MRYGNGAGVARTLASVTTVVFGEPSDGHDDDGSANDRTASRRWSLSQKIAFRWAFLYIALYCLPFPAGALPGLDWAEGLWQKLWHVFIVPWAGAQLLRLDQPVAFLPTGSSDTTFHWVQLFAYGAFATLGALVWSIVDRRRANHARLFVWLLLYVRYDVAWEMLRYGIHKLFALQFVTGPTLSRMLEAYGESSPFALASTFMGSSTTYVVLAGAAETVGGALLVFPRLATLGALVVAPVMVNVVLMNFCYDLPVKIHSSHILGLTLFLLLPEARRLANVIIFGRPVEAAAPRFLPLYGWKRNVRAVLKWAFVAALIVPMVLYNRAAADRFAARHPLYGIYEPAPGAPSGNVRTVVIDEVRVLAIRRESGPLQRFQIARSSEPGSLIVSPYRRPGAKSKLQYQTGDDNKLALTGTLDGEELDLRLRKVPTPLFLLRARGFHWVNDNAFDR